MLTRSLVKILLLALLAGLHVPASALAQAREKMILSVFLNGELKGEAFVFRMPDGDIFLVKDDFDELNFIVPGREKFLDGKTYISLRSLHPKVQYELNEEVAALRITAYPDAFEAASIGLAVGAPKGLLYPQFSSAFLNYGFDLDKSSDSSYPSLTAPYEAAVRLGSMLFYSSFNYIHTQDQNDNIRLYSNIVVDDRKRMVRYTAGDVNAAGGELGGSAVLTGFQAARNFGLDPFYLKYNGIDFTGALGQSADVELWSDNMLISKQHLGPGNFKFENIPLTTGTGDLVVVVKDAFGREHRIVLPYYFSSSNLRKYTHEYSYSAGYIREDLGEKSSEYGDPAFAMNHSYGFSEHVTAGLFGEGTDGLWNAGVSAHLILRPLGFFDAAAAASSLLDETDAEPVFRRGGAYSISYFNMIRRWGLSYRFSAKRASQYYAALSLDPLTDEHSRLETSSSLGYSSTLLGSFSVYYTTTDYFTESDTTTVTANYSRSLYKNLSLDVSASRTRTVAAQPEEDFYITLRYLFDATTYGSVTYQETSDGGVGGTMTVQRTPTGERGFGYRLYGQYNEYKNSEDTDDDDETTASREGELTYNGRHGIYSANAASSSGTETYSLNASGSVALVNGSVYLGRPISDSFAVVKLGSLEGVTVYSSGTAVDTTDGEGEILLPRIQSYGQNKILVQEKDVPMGYGLDSTTQYFAPPYRSGTFIDLGLQRVQAISGTVMISENGRKTPAEFWIMSVKIGDREESSPLVKDGEFYLENIPSGTHRAVLTKDDKECVFKLVVPESTEAVIALTPQVCTMDKGRK